jgi:hypothetical protein
MNQRDQETERRESPTRKWQMRGATRLVPYVLTFLAGVACCWILLRNPGSHVRPVTSAPVVTHEQADARSEPSKDGRIPGLDSRPPSDRIPEYVGSEPAAPEIATTPRPTAGGPTRSKYDGLKGQFEEFKAHSNTLNAALLASECAGIVLSHRQVGEPVQTGPQPPFPAGAEYSLTYEGRKYWVSRAECPAFVELQEFLRVSDEERQDPSFGVKRLGNIPESLRASVASLAVEALTYVADDSRSGR